MAAEAFAALAGGSMLDGDRFWDLKRAGATTRAALMTMGVAEALAAAVAARWRERIESDEWLARDRALPGVGRALAELRDGRVHTTVLTARSSAAGARRSLAAAGLAELVDALAVVDPGDVVAAKAVELRARDCGHFIGDTEADGAAAAAAGVPFTAVRTGQRSAAYLAARGFEVAGSLAEALALTGFSHRAATTPDIRA